MARWAIRQPHYLAVKDWEWEYTETDRATGRARRHKFPVPRYLHPDDPSDQTYNGEVTVAYENDNALPRDILFVGEPTPDMEPLDAEAVKISKSLQHKWFNAMGDAAFPAQGAGGFSDGILAKFETALAEIVNRVGIPKAENVSLKGVEPDILAQMQAQLADLARRNAELEAKVNGTPLEPVVDDLEPLPEVSEAELVEAAPEATPVPPPSALTNAPVRRL